MKRKKPINKSLPDSWKILKRKNKSSLDPREVIMKKQVRDDGSDEASGG